MHGHLGALNYFGNQPDRHENEQLFASKYKLVLPSEDELRAELEKEQLWLAEQGKAAK